MNKISLDVILQPLHALLNSSIKKIFIKNVNCTYQIKVDYKGKCLNYELDFLIYWKIIY
jgi:hypothetical protein